MLEKIEGVLDEFVRPQLSSHYGDVEVLGFNEGILEIKLTGQCSSCPSAKSTVENIVEAELKKHIPEITQVVLMQCVSDELLDFAKSILNHKKEN